MFRARATKSQFDMLSVALGLYGVLCGICYVSDYCALAKLDRAMERIAREERVATSLGPGV